MATGPRLSRMPTKKEVAGQLGLSLKTITREIQYGELPSHRFGGSVRIFEEDVASFTAARRR